MGTALGWIEKPSQTGMTFEDSKPERWELNPRENDWMRNTFRDILQPISNEQNSSQAGTTLGKTRPKLGRLLKEKRNEYRRISCVLFCLCYPRTTSRTTQDAKAQSIGKNWNFCVIAPLRKVVSFKCRKRSDDYWLRNYHRVLKLCWNNCKL